MPNTRFHIGVADLAMKSVHINNISDFYVGNVFPDAPWVPFSSSLKSGIRAQLHEYKFMSGVIISLADPHNWIIKHAAEVRDSDFMKGWFLHLLLDVNSNLLWNVRTSYTEFNTVSNKDIGIVDWDKLAKTKWKDVQSYSELRFQTFSPLVHSVNRWTSNECLSLLYSYKLTGIELLQIYKDISESTRDIKDVSIIDKPVTSTELMESMIDMTLSEFRVFMRMLNE